MKNESVAVLDIRSYEVTFLIGAKGVNGTFVFRGSKSEKYEGYTTEGFLDVESFCQAAKNCIRSVLQNYDGKIREIVVGVPAAFTRVYTKGQTISFPSKRKLTRESFDALYEAGLSSLMATGSYISRSGMYFSLGDNRKYFSADGLLGTPTSVLQGALCYYFADDKFVSAVEEALDEIGFEKTVYAPQTLASTLYLLPEKRREGYAFLLDIGFLSSSVSVVFGKGIVHEESFDFGTARILLSLMDGLDVEYEKAQEILWNANISGGAIAKDVRWTDVDGRTYSVAQINDIVKCGFDEICERVDGFFQKYYRDKSLPGFALNPLSVTGEGIGVRGAAEHISKRLGRMTETVCPDIPYYDKPAYSSRIALLAHALTGKEKRGVKKILFNLFGGKQK